MLEGMQFQLSSKLWLTRVSWGLRRRYGETKRNPARISERVGKTQLMAAFRPDDAKPLGADASLPVVQSTLHFSRLR